jgi:hypothetical protein
MGVHAASSAPSYFSRKMGASARALVHIGWQAVVVWGCRKSQLYAQLYTDNRFQVEPVFRVFFDFLVPPVL